MLTVVKGKIKKVSKLFELITKNIRKKENSVRLLSVACNRGKSKIIIIHPEIRQKNCSRKENGIKLEFNNFSSNNRFHPKKGKKDRLNNPFQVSHWSPRKSTQRSRSPSPSAKILIAAI